MTKKQIAKAISSKTGLSPLEATRAVEIFMEVSKEAICRGEGVFLRGFGTLYVQLRKAKVARVITKNESINLPAKNICKFRPCKEFAEELSKSMPPKEK